MLGCGSVLIPATLTPDIIPGCCGWAVVAVSGAVHGCVSESSEHDQLEKGRAFKSVERSKHSAALSSAGD